LIYGNVSYMLLISININQRPKIDNFGWTTRTSPDSQQISINDGSKRKKDLFLGTKRTLHYLWGLKTSTALFTGTIFNSNILLYQ